MAAKVMGRFSRENRPLIREALLLKTRTCKKCNQTFPLDRKHFSGGGKESGHIWECRECKKKYYKIYSKENPHKIKEKQSIRKAREALAGNLSRSDMNKIRDDLRIKQNNLCYYCRGNISGIGELDHKIAISIDTRYIEDNFVLSCRSCNASKHNKTPDEFRDWLISRGNSGVFLCDEIKGNSYSVNEHEASIEDVCFISPASYRITNSAIGTKGLFSVILENIKSIFR